MVQKTFVLEDIELTAEQIRQLTPLQKKSGTSVVKRARTQFVMLPYNQALVVAGRLKNAQLAVLVELTHQVFKTHNNPVPLTNAALRSAGLSRWSKNRALRELEKVGLVTVRWRGKKCPLVTLLW